MEYFLNAMILLPAGGVVFYFISMMVSLMQRNPRRALEEVRRAWAFSAVNLLLAVGDLILNGPDWILLSASVTMIVTLTLVMGQLMMHPENV